MDSKQERFKDAPKVMMEQASGREHEASTVSPYATRAIIVSIGASGAKYTLFEANLNQCPVLKQRVNPARYDGIDLPEVDEDVGHTLIHYLLTGQYQTLGSDSVPDDWKAATEFKRSVQAYCAAILCGIEGLEDFAKTKMEELSSELSVFDMQRVLEEMSTKLPQNDAWLPGQMHKWIKGKLVLDDTLLTEGLVLDVIGRSALFDRAVVQGVTDMYSLEKAKVRIALNWKDSERVSQDSTTATSKANGAAEGKISLALPVEVKNDRAKATIHAEPQQRSAPPTAPVYSRPQNIAESVKPMDINFQKARTHRVDSQSAQEGSDVFAHDSEEILPAETPSEINAGSSPEELSRTPTGKTFETGRRGSEMNGEAPHTDNLKATDDSDGEGAKTKSKKSKKAKKRNSTGV